MNILFIGDIVGRPGRDLMRAGLDAIVSRYRVDFVIANAENAAGGFGITREIGDDLLAHGVDVMTSGNHIWDKKEAIGYIGVEARLLRPINYPAGVPGRGSYVGRTADGRAVGVINAHGPRVHADDRRPLRAWCAGSRERCGSGRRSSSWTSTPRRPRRRSRWGGTSPGKVTAVVGTHTHVQTADDRILPGGTAYITDVGMTGPHDGIIGVEREPALGALPQRACPPGSKPRAATRGCTRWSSPPIAETGRATAITRLSLSMADLLTLAAAQVDEAEARDGR